MVSFFKYIGKVFTIFLVVIILLDVIYTSIYLCASPRNTFQYILNLKNKKIDYVFLGSSRTANTIVTSEVERQTGKKAMNLGMEGAWLSDNLLQLKLLLDQGNKIENVFLQLDYQYEDANRMSTQKSVALPFIHKTIIKDHIKDKEQDFFKLYYIPFYRYLKADFKIGFRELFSTLIGKSPKINPEDGFTPKYGTVKLDTKVLPVSIKKNNETIDTFVALCKKSNIKLVLFCAPFCSKVQNKDYIEKLKIKQPKLQVFSNSFNDSLFYDCSHLNNKGALLFTKRIISRNFKNE